jgi:hypothetical protein
MEPNNISHQDMVAKLCKSGRHIIAELTHQGMHNLHMAVGIVGEIAEIVEAYKFLEENKIDPHHLKTFSLSMDKEGKEILKKGVELVLEEHGDLEFYMEGLRQQTGILRAENFHTMHHPSVLRALVIAGGHLIDAVKRQAIYGKQLDLAKLNSAMFEVDNCVHALSVNSQFTREEYLAANIQKLGKRYQDFVYSNKAAIDRADKPAGE